MKPRYLLLSLVALPWVQTQCAAHAFLDHADPKVGSVIETAPAEIKIWFTQELEPAFSAIEVRDANGKEIDRNDTHLDEVDKTLLIVSVPHCDPEVYKVAWHVVSVDTHKTHGDFKFTVKPQN